MSSASSEATGEADWGRSAFAEMPGLSPAVTSIGTRILEGFNPMANIAPNFVKMAGLSPAVTSIGTRILEGFNPMANIAPNFVKMAGLSPAVTSIGAQILEGLNPAVTGVGARILEGLSPAVTGIGTQMLEGFNPAVTGIGAHFAAARVAQGFTPPTATLPAYEDAARELLASLDFEPEEPIPFTPSTDDAPYEMMASAAPEMAAAIDDAAGKVKTAFWSRRVIRNSLVMLLLGLALTAYVAGVVLPTPWNALAGGSYGVGAAAVQTYRHFSGPASEGSGDAENDP